MSISERVSELFAKPLLLLLSYMLPKKKASIVFAQDRGRYTDNPKALFEWVAKNKQNPIRWIYSGDAVPAEVAEELRDKFILQSTWAAAFAVLRAKVVVVSHGVNDLGWLKYAARHAKMVYVWHGISIKNIGLTDNKLTAKDKKRFASRESCRVDAFIASSDVDRYHIAAYMGVNVNKVFVTGLPRNDALAGKPLRRAPGSVFKVLYAPTFRDKPQDFQGSLFFPFDDFDVEAATCVLAQHKIQIHFRAHPNDRQSQASADKLVGLAPHVYVDASASLIPDINSVITDFDLVITDYSSIYIDTLVFDQPCLFVPFDRAAYLQHRGLAFDYDLVTPGPKVASMQELLAAMIGFCQGQDGWASERALVRKLFHRYPEGQACARVYDVMAKFF